MYSSMNIFEKLAILADVLQIANYEQNVLQTTNDDIMKEIQRQNNDFLEDIKDMLKRMDTRLERLENDRRLL